MRRSLITMLFLPILSGCMSLVTLVGSDEENRSAACNASGQTVSRIYLGTQVDLAAIPSIAEGGAGNVAGLFLLDLPFSIVADTVLLPITVPFQIAKGDITCSGQTVLLSDQPSVDLTDYPKEWASPTIEAGKDCTAVYGTFGKSNDANADVQFRAFSELMLRTSEGINNSSRLKIHQSTSDPEFIVTDALNKKGLVESSGIRATCRNGVLLIYPQSIPGRDGQTVASHSARLYNNSERFLVIGDSVEQCQKNNSGRKKSCKKSIHWSRLQRLEQ